ncbi:hypothetical protein [Providencia huaxiensis]|uniref:hypothetical protein n=1 Tax=Providencia huaxiensis TaxID=2027290 RepID=UPI0034E4D30A
MKERKHKNIWQINGIPPLEYCSIQRATEILSCKHEDILHWRSFDTIYCGAKLDVSALIYIYTKKKMESITDELPLDRYGYIRFGHGLIRVDKPSDIHFFNEHNGIFCYKLESDVYGIFRARALCGYDENDKLVYLTNDDPTELKFNLWSCHPQKEDENSIIKTIIMKTEHNINVNIEPATSNFLVFGSDIEKIYKYANLGQKMPHVNISTDIDSEILETKPTINKGKLSEFLDFIFTTHPKFGSAFSSESEHIRYTALASHLDDYQKLGQFSDYKLPSPQTITKYFSS